MTETIVQDYRDFESQSYLHEYYDHLGPENEGLLTSLSQVYAAMPADQRLLEIGGGPTIYQLISAAPHVASIRFTDYSVANLHEVADWVNGVPGAFDWDDFIASALRHEGAVDSSHEDVARRRELVQQKITQMNQLDIRQPLRLGDTCDIISTHFVAESISASDMEWQQLMHHMIDGSQARYVVMSALYGAHMWQNGDRQYAAANISPSDAEAFFVKAGFAVRFLQTIPAEHIAESSGYQGYEGLFVIAAERSDL